MLWVSPLAIVLFVAVTLQKVLRLPPMWDVRASTMQTYMALLVAPLVGCAAWTGSRERRSRIDDLVEATARPRWARELVSWAATTAWAAAVYMACVAALYAVTAAQATGGGPLFWPVWVGLACLPAFSAVGFAAGAWLPSRFTAPLATVGAFFALALSTQPIMESSSPWQLTPLVSSPWNAGDSGAIGIFYHYLPDLAIAQVMFLVGLSASVLGLLGVPRRSGGRRLRLAAAAVTSAGLVAMGTAVGFVVSAHLGPGGMIVVPAVHDAADDRPIQYVPTCSRTPIEVCMNPPYRIYLAAVASDLAPLLRELGGVPGAPARLSQVATVFALGPGNQVSVSMAGPVFGGSPPVLHFVLPVQLAGPAENIRQTGGTVALTVAPEAVAQVLGWGVIGSPAQRVLYAAILRESHIASLTTGTPGAEAEPGGFAPVFTQNLALSVGEAAAERRFLVLPTAEQHSWLVSNVPAVRAGRVPVGQIP
jgi:hypothetical protein